MNNKMVFITREELIKIGPIKQAIERRDVVRELAEMQIKRFVEAIYECGYKDCVEFIKLKVEPCGDLSVYVSISNTLVKQLSIPKETTKQVLALIDEVNNGSE